MPDLSRLWVSVVAATGGAALAGCAVGDLDADSSEATGREASAIVNGQATTEFPTAGVLLLDGNPAWLVCSGTLIGCDRFLTAAHCVCFADGSACQNTSPAERMHVYLQNGGFFAVTRRHVHPAFSFPDNDVAVLELARPAVGLLPSPLADQAPTLGQDGVIVGYGRSGGPSHDYGIKQFGPVVTAACPADAGGPGHVCWNFRGDGANTCNGDSGGPLFVESQEGGGLTVAGITSGGTRSDCLAGDHSYDTDVFAFRDYIIGSAGGDGRLGQVSCGELPHVGEVGAEVTSQQGVMGAGQSAHYQVEVGAGTAELRVSLNASEGSRPAFYVRAGQVPTALRHDCAEEGPSSYGFCEIHSPAPGTWHILVRAAGASSFQLTSTALAGAPAPADDAYAAIVDVPLEVAAADGVLANDADAGRRPLEARIASGPAHGQVEFRGDGSFTYTPRSGYAGADSFTYQASDGAYHGTARVELTIAAVPPAQNEGGADRNGDDSALGGGCTAAGGASGLAGWLIVALGLALVRPRHG